MRFKSLFPRIHKILERGGIDMGAANVRILLALGVLTYLFVREFYQGKSLWDYSGIVYIAIVYLAYSILQWVSNLLWPGPNVVRRAISILADTSVVTYAMIAAGETTSLFYGGFLWATIANGLRYGRKYLYVTNIFSVLGFSLVLWFTPYWRSQIILGAGLMVWLILLPGYVTVLLKRLEDALHKANFANKTKSNFLSNMSHELRTPLNVILGYSDMLQEDAVADGNRQMADDMGKIQRSANHLLELINGILDLSRLESGRMHLSSECFDIRLLFENILAGMRQEFERRGNVCAIRFNLEQYQINTDKLKLKQIISNILDNANKFTENGQIQIDVFSPAGNANAVMTIEIRDTGIGIPANKLSSIFEPFVQADTSSTRKYEGAGLGLTIARRFAEILEGSVTVRSQEFKGSVFTVSIPQRLALCAVNEVDEYEHMPPRKLAG